MVSRLESIEWPRSRKRNDQCVCRLDVFTANTPRLENKSRFFAKQMPILLSIFPSTVDKIVYTSLMKTCCFFVVNRRHYKEALTESCTYTWLTATCSVNWYLTALCWCKCNRQVVVGGDIGGCLQRLRPIRRAIWFSSIEWM